MKNIYIVWVTIILLLLSIVTYLGFNIINKNKEYRKIEDNAEEVVSQYLGQYIDEYPSVGSKKIKIADVINQGYDLNMSVNKDECDGYVVVKKVSIAYEYKGYIKCENYITNGYENK